VWFTSRVSFAMNQKFASVEGGERGILSRRWSMWRCFYYSSKNKTLLALVHCIPCFFLPQNFAPKPYPKTDYGKFYSGDSYIVLFVSMIWLKLVELLGWLREFISFFRPKKTEAPSAGTFTFGSETRPRRFDTFYLSLNTHVFDCSTLEIFVFLNIYFD
jgi:hypothetical protein